MEDFLGIVTALATAFAILVVGVAIVMYVWNLLLVPWLGTPKIEFWLVCMFPVFMFSLVPFTVCFIDKLFFL